MHQPTPNVNVPIAKKRWIFEGDDAMSFPTGFHKSQIRAVINNGIVEASMNLITEASCKSAELVSTAKIPPTSTTWRDKAANKSKPTYGLLKTENPAGPSVTLRYHIKCGKNKDDALVHKDYRVKDWFDIDKKIKNIDLKLLTKTPTHNTFYLKADAPNDQAIIKCVPSDVIITPWKGKNTPVDFNDKQHKAKFFLGNVHKTASEKQIEEKISDLLENFYDTKKQDDSGDDHAANFVELRQIKPKRETTTNEYNNFYLVLQMETKAVEFNYQILDYINEKLPNGSFLRKWNRIVSPPKKIRKKSDQNWE